MIYACNFIWEKQRMVNTSCNFWDLLDKLFAEHKLIIDRPKGSAHPRHKSFVYPLDYGYLEGTSSQDGDGIDVWVGSSQKKRVVGVISSVDYIKKDSEIKILYACTKSEIDLVIRQHNSTKYMKGILNIRFDI